MSGVLIIRVIVYWSLYCGPLFWETTMSTLTLSPKLFVKRLRHGPLMGLEFRVLGSVTLVCL